jgi:5-formyltetrahydrofolate cyclo-ligase
MAADTKAERRRALLAVRRAVPDDVREIEAEQLRSHLDVAVGGARTVCAYLPVGTEPGSPDLLDRLRELCDVVLLPVTRTGSDGEHLPLWWGEYKPGHLFAARFGLREPTPPWLEPTAIAGADVVLVPALAVDRTGVRLGRGGGYYDRSLPLCTPGTRLIAVLRDDELVETLPEEAHDVRMTHVLTPGAGLLVLGGNERVE